MKSKVINISLFLALMFTSFCLSSRFRFFNRKLNRIYDFRKPFSLITDKFIESAVRNWVGDFVHGQGMCPFVAAVLNNDKISYSIIRSSSQDSLIENICEQSVQNAIQIISHDNVQPNVTTTLIIIPELEDFDIFLSVAGIVEAFLEDSGLDGLLQVATFHPKYQFNDADTEDVTNWTNRSPFPILHILRVDDVETAIKNYPGDMDSIWERNKNKLKTLGKPEVLEIIERIIDKSRKESS